MKNILTSVSILNLFCQVVLSQPTNKMNYQAVARNSSGALLANQTIGLRLSIEDGPGGNIIYQERQVPLTNQFGLFTLQLGSGIVLSGVWNNIVWGSGDHWLLVEMDPAGGTNYVSMGESQLLTVPYAQYSQFAATSGNGGLNNMQVYSAAGTFQFIVPSGVKKIMIELWGGGGGGGTSGRAGGGGGYGKGIYNVNSGDTLAVVVGAGIAGSSTVWQDGGTSSVGTLVYATGGRSGYTGGQVGGTSNAPHHIEGGTGGGCVGCNSYQGGFSPCGGNGGYPNNSGIEPGGGGGAGNPSPYGNGANGRVIIYW